MSEHRSDEHRATTAPVPRDMPDQQVTEGDDPWDLKPGRGSGERRDEPHRDTGADADAEDSGRDGGDEEPRADVPDTDEAGTGRRGAPHAGSPNPEHPVPDESPA
ncbi:MULTISPECIES: hypothetical protein [unclassified Streptomyces]|uniref:Uncharacterized protein n=1 Tax=Streptomyces thermocoprophilus TaxID=78356 RepID=A0ABV5V7N7_9ACTN